MPTDHFLQDLLDDDDAYSFKDKVKITQGIMILSQIIEALGEFEDNYHKKLNLTKLMSYFKVHPSLTADIVTLIMEFQKRITITFKDYWIKSTIVNGNVFLITEPKDKKLLKKVIYFTKEDQKFISDIIYIHKFLKKGKGISLIQENSSFIQNLIKLKSNHPYLFRTNEDNLLFPSDVGLKIGEIIHSHYKCNKIVDKIELEQYQFIFE